MGSNRVLLHQLSGGLYVSGAPDQHKEKAPTMTSSAMPYTGGDIKKSGELGKMFDINVETPKSRKSGPITMETPKSRKSGSLSVETPKVKKSGSLNNTGTSNISSSVSTRGGSGSFRASNSGPLNPPPPPQITDLGSFSRGNSHSDPPPKIMVDNSHNRSGNNLKTSGPLSRQNSGPLTPSLPATGLITSGPISSAPASRGHSGPIDSNTFTRNSSTQATKNPSNQAINHLTHDHSHSVIKSLPRIILWTVVPLFIIGFIAGGFILGAVENAVLLIIVVCLFGFVILLLLWNSCMGRRAVTGFVNRYPDFGLNEAKDGQYVKITGIVTCGSVPLETSYQKVNRCVYTSCGVYEYRHFGAKPAKPKHKIFTWGLRHIERRVTDFYISDYKSGLRALVKVGYGASVTPYVEDSTIVNVPRDGELSSYFLRWLSDRNLSRDERAMRLKEGYIREGSTVTVMGVVQRTDNVLMIVPPSDPISTGCQWREFFLPATLPGIVLICEDKSKDDVIPV